jgi:hypothetical protein
MLLSMYRFQCDQARRGIGRTADAKGIREPLLSKGGFEMVLTLVYELTSAKALSSSSSSLVRCASIMTGKQETRPSEGRGHKHQQ